MEVSMTEPHFNGPVYDPALDHERLTKQLGRVFEAIRDGEWRTLAELEAMTGGEPQASISAQLRHLRKPRFGNYVIEKRRREPEGGTWEYRMEDREQQEMF
jgi:hypothetical protein